MLEYTRIEIPMKVRATCNKILYSTTQGVLLVVFSVRGTDDV